MSTADAHRALVEAAYRDRSLLREPAHEAAVLATIEALDKGQIRVASPVAEGGEWEVHAW